MNDRSALQVIVSAPDEVLGVLMQRSGNWCGKSLTGRPVVEDNRNKHNKDDSGRRGFAPVNSCTSAKHRALFLRRAEVVVCNDETCPDTLAVLTSLVQPSHAYHPKACLRHEWLQIISCHYCHAEL